MFRIEGLRLVRVYKISYQEPSLSCAGVKDEESLVWDLKVCECFYL